VSDRPLGATVADVDENGQPDVVVPMWNQIAVITGTSSGFAAPQYLAVPIDTYAFELTVGDVNLDGHADILTGNTDIYYGDGSGGFSLSRFDAFGDAPTVLDYTGDGVPDLLLSSADWLIVMPGERNEKNRPPLVSAGPDRTAEYSWLAGDFTLDAQASDPDHHELTYEWRNAAGDVVSTSSNVWPGLLSPGRYVFTVSVFDGRGGSASDTMTLTVQPYKEIVIHPAWLAWMKGNWRVVEDATAASGARLSSRDAGAPKVAAPAANPDKYF
jgi:hypothetical protein